MNAYIAFLRGINVGGKSLIKMAALKSALANTGFSGVHTYIQSGNVFITTDETDKKKTAVKVAACITKNFNLSVAVALFSEQEWRRIIDDAPGWWGKDKDWKHNIFILIEPYDKAEVTALHNVLKSEYEKLEVGPGVLYQSIAWSAVGKGATGSKLVSNTLYKQMTIRNFNTATRLADLFEVVGDDR